MIDALRQEKARYEILYDAVRNVANKIKQASYNLDGAVNNIRENYSVNEEAYDKGKIKITKDRLDSKASELTGSIMPMISSKISQIDAEIKRLEEEERRALEEMLNMKN